MAPQLLQTGPPTGSLHFQHFLAMTFARLTLTAAPQNQRDAIT
jgi:hypothetical protein